MASSSGLSVKDKVEIKTVGTGISKILDKWKKQKNIKTVEEIADPEKQLELFKKQQLKMIDSRILYNPSNTERNEKLITLYREPRISNCNNEDITRLSFMNSETKRNLMIEGYTLIHVGLLIIGIKGLHRKELGTRVFVSIIDRRHNNILQSILGSLEIDMSRNNQLAYCIPDCILPIKDFDKNIQLIIKTKGYNMEENSENLLVCQGLIGKVTTGSDIKYTIEEVKIVDYLTSKGIKVLPAEKIEIERSLEWNLGNLLDKEVEVPRKSLYYENIKGELSCRFIEYEKIKDEDSEEINGE